LEFRAGSRTAVDYVREQKPGAIKLASKKVIGGSTLDVPARRNSAFGTEKNTRGREKKYRSRTSFFRTPSSASAKDLRRASGQDFKGKSWENRAENGAGAGGRVRVAGASGGEDAEA
jgi:hypothetical protein